MKGTAYAVVVVALSGLTSVTAAEPTVGTTACHIVGLLSPEAFARAARGDWSDDWVIERCAGVSRTNIEEYLISLGSCPKDKIKEFIKSGAHPVFCKPVPASDAEQETEKIEEAGDLSVLARQALVKDSRWVNIYWTYRRDTARGTTKEGTALLRTPEQLKQIIAEAEMRLRLEPDPDKKANIDDEIANLYAEVAAVHMRGIRFPELREDFPALLQEVRREIESLR